MLQLKKLRRLVIRVTKMTKVVRMTKVVKIRSRGILWFAIQILYIFVYVHMYD